MKILTEEMTKHLDYENNQYFFTNMLNFNGLNLGDLFLGILMNYEKLKEAKKHKKIILLTHRTFESILNLFFDGIFDDILHVDIEILNKITNNNLQNVMECWKGFFEMVTVTTIHSIEKGRVHKIVNTPALKNNIDNIRETIKQKLELIKKENEDKILPSNSILLCFDTSELKLIKNQAFILKKVSEKYNNENIFIRKIKGSNYSANINNREYQVYDENVLYLLTSCLLDSSIKIISNRNGLMDILNLFSNNPLLVIYRTGMASWFYFANLNKPSVFEYCEKNNSSLLNIELDKLFKIKNKKVLPKNMINQTSNMKVLTKDMIKNLDYNNNQYFFSSLANMNGLNVGDLFFAIIFNYNFLKNNKKKKILLTHRTFYNLLNLFFCDIFDDFYHVDIEILKEISNNDIDNINNYNRNFFRMVKVKQIHYQAFGRTCIIFDSPELMKVINEIKISLNKKLKIIKEQNKNKLLPSQSILVCFDASNMKLAQNQDFILKKLKDNYNNENIYIRKFKDSNCAPNINSRDFQVYDENIYYMIVSCLLDHSIQLISFRNGLMDILNLFSDNPLLIIYPTTPTVLWSIQNFRKLNKHKVLKVLEYYEGYKVSELDRQLDLFNMIYNIEQLKINGKFNKHDYDITMSRIHMLSITKMNK